MKTFISIIIPVYNIQDYIQRCIDSIIYQDFKDFEIILVDDGAKDKSGAICDEYALKDKRLKVIHQENSGVSIARNKGLELASGEWVWFVDGDDYILPGAIKSLYEASLKYDCDTIYFNMLNSWNGKINYPVKELIEISDLPKDEFLCNVRGYVNPGIVFSRKILEKNRINFTQGIIVAEDLEVRYKYLLFAKKPILIAESLYVYQHRLGSATINPNTKKNSLRDSFKVAENLLSFSEENIPSTEKWFGLAIRELLKGAVQSLKDLPSEHIRESQSALRRLLKISKIHGLQNVPDRALKIARINLYLYVICLRLYLKFRIQ